MHLNDIVSRFQSPKKNGNNSFMVRCPCHNDNTQSLSISEENGKILLNCFAGCRTEDILHSVGLEMKDLFTDKPNHNTPKPPNVEYIYSDKLKKIRYYKWDNGQWKKLFYWQHKDENGKWQSGKGNCKVPLYKQNLLSDVPPEETVYIVEGEKDCDTMTDKLHFRAVSAPNGATATKGNTKSKWNSDYNSLFRNLNVAIIPDNDEVGRAYAETIANELLPVTKSVKIVDLCNEWENLKDKGDITDVYETEQPIREMTVAESVAFRLSAWVEYTKPYERKVDMSKYIQLSNVESTTTEWLWYPYIPMGKITLITADPGTGKTFLALYLAAQVSTGRPFYGESAYTAPKKVVYQTAEDGIADTIKPRLEPMRPNFENIYIFNEESQSLSLSDDKIEQIMKDLHPGLMIFDPLQAYLGADVDMHRANEVRPILGRIGHLAERYNCAVVFIMHNSKMSQNSALHRALGSIDIPAVARSMLILGKDPENFNRKIICHEKSSLAPNGKSILFEVDTSKGGVLFCGYSNLKADDILNVHSATRNKASAKKDEVCDRLLELFAEKDFIKFTNTEELCERLNCKKSTLYSIKSDLKLQSVSVGFGQGKVTYWLMPEADAEKFKAEHKLQDNSIIPK